MTRADLVLLVANVVYATSYVATRVTLGSVPPAALAGIRLVLGALVLAPFSGRPAGEPPLSRGDRRAIAWMGLVGFAGAYVLSHWGIARSTATNASLLIVVEPLSLMLLSPFYLGERLSRREALGAALAVGGTVLVVVNGIPGVTEALVPHWQGDGLLVLAGLAYAAYSLLGRRVLERHAALGVTARSLAWGAAGIVPVVGAEWAAGSRPTWTAAAVAGTLYLAVVISAVGYVAWNWALARVPTPRAALFLNLQPIVGALLGAALLGEPLTVFTVVGGVAIVAGLGVASGARRGECILEDVPEPRRYQLQNDHANRLVAELLDAAEVPADRRGYLQQLLTTVLKLHEDGAGTGDLKITNTALKELRYAYKVFAPYSGTRKVTVFGSARASSSEEATENARLFGTRMTDEGWMVVTGAGAGIMGAAQEGAGGERSFGLNIRLPFEQEANPWIASDPKLITFKYFFTRKLFLVKEASAVALFPGGYGTMDETFELLTLMQTGKSALIPVVLVEAGPKPYWRIWHRWIAGTLVERGLIDPEDTSLFRIVDTLDEAVAEITGFYRVYHSSRIVDDDLVFRLARPLAPTALAELQDKFADILKGPVTAAPGPVPQESNEFPDLPRLILPFDHRSFGRLRQLIDFVNQL